MELKAPAEEPDAIPTTLQGGIDLEFVSSTFSIPLTPPTCFAFPWPLAKAPTISFPSVDRAPFKEYVSIFSLNSYSFENLLFDNRSIVFSSCFARTKILLSLITCKAIKIGANQRQLRQLQNFEGRRNLVNVEYGRGEGLCKTFFFQIQHLYYSICRQLLSVILTRSQPYEAETVTAEAEAKTHEAEARFVGLEAEFEAEFIEVAEVWKPAQVVMVHQ